MPLYEYKCPYCNAIEECLQSSKAALFQPCPCGKVTHRIQSVIGNFTIQGFLNGQPIPARPDLDVKVSKKES